MLCFLMKNSMFYRDFVLFIQKIVFFLGFSRFFHFHKIIHFNFHLRYFHTSDGIASARRQTPALAHLGCASSAPTDPAHPHLRTRGARPRAPGTPRIRTCAPGVRVLGPQGSRASALVHLGCARHCARAPGAPALVHLGCAKHCARAPAHPHL